MTASPSATRTNPLRCVIVVIGASAAVAVLALVASTLGPATAGTMLVLTGALAGLATRRLTAVEVLVIAVVMLLLIPARYRFEPLGALGTPAALIGLGAFGIWLIGALSARPWLAPRHHPLRWAMLGVFVAVLFSYIAIGFRPHDVLEARAVDRGILTMLSAIGIALFAADLIRSRQALLRVMQAVVGAGGVVAAAGVVQFVTEIDLASVVQLPGFTFVSSDYSAERAGFVRIVSTASHPIELSVMLTMLLPLGLWLSFNSAGRAQRLWWATTAVIAMSIPMTVSRTGVLGLAIGLAVILPFYSGRRRVRLLLIGLAGLVVMRFVTPGLIGTLRSFLVSPGEDPSLLSRQEARQQAIDFFVERPLWGRGFGTFLPERYTFLDNQILLSAVETGVLGLLAFAGIFATSAVLAVKARAAARGPFAGADRELAVALLGALAVAGGTWFTYDALSFPSSRSLTFLVMGIIAAMWRIVTIEAADESPADQLPAKQAPVEKRPAQARPPAHTGR